MTQVTNIQDVIRNHTFFTEINAKHNIPREIIEIKEEDLSVMIKFKEPGDEISSQLTVLRGKFREEGQDKVPAYVLFITLGSVVKMEIDEEFNKSFKVMLAPMNDSENIELDFEGDFSEEDFFQQSTLHDFRNVSYGHVNVIKDLVEKMTSYEKYLDSKEA